MAEDVPGVAPEPTPIATRVRNWWRWAVGAINSQLGGRTRLQLGGCASPGSRVTQAADDLLAQALRGDEVGIHLLEEFFHGYPVEQLRRLFASDNDAAVRNGVWIASELGVSASPLLEDLIALTRHPLKNARFWAIDALWGIGSRAGESTAAIVGAIDDQEKVVRWEVMQFLARARAELLSAGIDRVGDPEINRLFTWFIDVDARSDAAAIIQMLQYANPRARLFAAAAAARIAKRDDAPLRLAAVSTDPEVASFAQQRLAAPPAK
jgi:hypothetical protein